METTMTSRWREELAGQRSSRRRFLAQSALFGATAALGGAQAVAAVGQSQLHRLTAAKQAEGSLLRFRYPNFPILDPHFVTNGMWFDATALLEGLTVADEAGTAAIPGAAEKWDVSPDGKVYTFTMRQGATWSNGDPVTARDFEWTYQRLLTPQGTAAGVTLGANSYQPTLGIVGARDFLGGIVTDWAQVGIKTLDEQRLEITLENPNLDFLLLLTHPSMLPLHPATLEALPEDWQLPENWVGNGPFVLTEWVINSNAQLAPNEQYWDRQNVLLSGVEVQLVEGEDTTGAVAYESGEVEIVGLLPADIVRFQSDPELSEQMRTIEGGSVIYLAVLRSRNPVMEDVRVRQALALGMDRETIAKANPAAQPGLSLVPTSVPEWDNTGVVPFDVEQAKQLLADAGYPDGEGLPEIKILAGGLVNPLQEAMADLWQKNLGIKVKLDIVEAGVYVERRWAVQEEDYVGFYWGSYGSPPLWTAWAANLWGPEFTQQFSLTASAWEEYQAIQNDANLDAATKTAQLSEFLAANASDLAKQYGATVQQAMAEADPETQLQLLKQGADERQQTYLFVPVSYAVAYLAVKPNVTGLNLHQGGRQFYLKGVGLESGG
ncbi:MAG: peptide ABC transporter substrate-binding protein [Thermomicrobiales bacterium]